MNLREAKAGAESENTSRLSNFRTAVRTAIITASSVVVLLVVTLLMIGVVNDNNRKGQAGAVTTTPPVQTVRQVQSDPCDNLYKPYIVYPTPSVITGTVGCFVGVKVRSTAPVILIGERGEESAPIYKDSPDQWLNLRVVEWKTVPGQVAQVQARLFRQ